MGRSQGRFNQSHAMPKAGAVARYTAACGAVLITCHAMPARPATDRQHGRNQSIPTDRQHGAPTDRNRPAWPLKTTMPRYCTHRRSTQPILIFANQNAGDFIGRFWAPIVICRKICRKIFILFNIIRPLNDKGR